MIIEQNREIIRQLYAEVTSGKKPVILPLQPAGNGFTQYTVSAKPSSLKTFKQFLCRRP